MTPPADPLKAAVVPASPISVRTRTLFCVATLFIAAGMTGFGCSRAEAPRWAQNSPILDPVLPGSSASAGSLALYSRMLDEQDKDESKTK